MGSVTGDPFRKPQQLVVGGDRWQGRVIREEPGDDSRGIGEAALGETDDSSLGTTSMLDEATIQACPTLCFVPWGLDRFHIGGNRADRQRSRDSGDDVLSTHRPRAAARNAS